MSAASRLRSFHLCVREEAHWITDCFLFFFVHKGDERVAERSGQTDQGTQAGGQPWSRSCSRCTCMHYHSFTVCHPPLLCHSVSFLYSHILLSSSTYFLGGGGGGCRYTTRSSVWETQSKTGTDSPRCTDHSAGLHPLWSPRCRSLTLHLQFALCLCWGLLSCHINPVNLLPPLNHTHTNTCALLLRSIHISVISLPAGEVASNLRHYTSLTSIDCEEDLKSAWGQCSAKMSQDHTV